MLAAVALFRGGSEVASDGPRVNGGFRDCWRTYNQRSSDRPAAFCPCRQGQPRSRAAHRALFLLGGHVTRGWAIKLSKSDEMNASDATNGYPCKNNSGEGSREILFRRQQICSIWSLYRSATFASSAVIEANRCDILDGSTTAETPVETHSPSLRLSPELKKWARMN